MINMTRREHYQRAKALIPDTDARVQADILVSYASPVMTEVDRERLALASVHATLASVAAEVAGEAVELGTPERWVLDPLEVRLEAALEELKGLGVPQHPEAVAAFIRERVLGGEAARGYVEGRYGKCGPGCEEGHTYRAGCALESKKEEGR